MNTPVYLSKPALSSALGRGLTEHITQLLNPHTHSPLSFSTHWSVKEKNLPFGIIQHTLRPFPTHLDQQHQSRNNQLLWDTLAQIEPDIQQLLNQYDSSRIAIVIGTSTTGNDENTPVFKHVIQGGSWHDLPLKQQQQFMSAPADFIAEVYGINGLCYGVSTACTSGARALISAARLLHLNIADAVICGGVDTLSELTINGFDSLEVLSPNISNPFSQNRTGINIGEAAAIFIMTKHKPKNQESLALLGYGSSSDAYHMSSPDPSGKGAILAFQAALNHAHLKPKDIGWINLHGTGTLLNDSMESIAIADVFGLHTPCTSTKPLTGHTLGAAGALEAAFLWGIISQTYNPTGKLPTHIWDNEPDCSLPNIALTSPESYWQTNPRIGASSSFAFGGNNSVLIIGEY